MANKSLNFSFLETSFKILPFILVPALILLVLGAMLHISQVLIVGLVLLGISGILYLSMLSNYIFLVDSFLGSKK